MHSIKNKPASSHLPMRGFTLVELIVTVAIAGILLLVGVPSLLRLISGSLITSYSDALTGSFALARTQAIVEKSSVTICKSTDLVSCDTAANWSDGWIVFTDANQNQLLDGTDIIIRVHESLTQTGLTYNNGDYLQYGYKGDLISGAGSFTFCPSDNDTDRAQGLIIAATGRVRTSTGPFTCP